ncbi:MAG: hypothetical protein AB7O97_13020 [Planctomycetota bacterium]
MTRRPIPPLLTHAATAFLTALALPSMAAAQWRPIAPAGGPTGRVQAAMAFEPLFASETLLFGGRVVGGALDAETWSLGSGGWTLRTPATSPSARAGHDMVFDLGRGVMVLYGGFNPSPAGGLSLDDTWEWNGTDWTQAAPLATPGGRAAFGMAYDALRGRTVVYGGIANSLLLGATNTTFEYDGSTWTQVATAGPGPRVAPAMAFHAVIGRVVLHGGTNPLSGPTGSTWTFDGTTWTAVGGPGPSPRGDARMVYDDRRAETVLHGGADGSGALLADTWAFDGAVWRQDLAVGTAPGARSRFAMALATGRGPVLFGGVDAGGNGPTDTWEYGAEVDPFGAGCPGSSGVPLLAALGTPRLGRSFAVALSGLLPAAPIGVVAIGFSDTTAGGLPLPFDLTVVGMTGCTLLVDPQIVEAAPAAGGQAVHTLAIPLAAHLLGATFFEQGFSFELPGWNAFGGVTSGALRCIVGN